VIVHRPFEPEPALWSFFCSIISPVTRSSLVHFLHVCSPVGPLNSVSRKSDHGYASALRICVCFIQSWHGVDNRFIRLRLQSKWPLQDPPGRSRKNKISDRDYMMTSALQLHSHIHTTASLKIPKLCKFPVASLHHVLNFLNLRRQHVLLMAETVSSLWRLEAPFFLLLIYHVSQALPSRLQRHPPRLYTGHPTSCIHL
jgi:hypothetical protein